VRREESGSVAAPVWTPSFGAWPEGDGVRFRVWAEAGAVDVVVEGRAGARGAEPPVRLERQADATFAGWVPGLRPGDRYRYRLDGDGPFPDPASRYQPEGVHGPSAVIDPQAFRWTDTAWRGLGERPLVFYELHTGTFTTEGTFGAAIEKLVYVRDLGITAIELMPVADFPGARNWGYDGVSLFAPARCYGPPDELRRLIDVAHGLDLAVYLDVVYNHFGPDGAYIGRFAPSFFSTRHESVWGAGINLDGPRSELVRAFFIENALHWIHEYHLDGLRLDATHALADESPHPFLAELAARVRAASGGRDVHLIAEDHRNLARMLREPEQGGWGLDGVWADDFHHQMRRLLAGDSEGYYQDFSGSIDDLVTTVRQGWFFTGQHSKHLDEPRGTDPAGIPLERFVICLQNHDQIGNRALGERLSAHIAADAYRAATALLLTLPETPLLFMGQEWAARTPFLYFTDHTEELGRLVTEGRRKEFRHFAAFSDPAARDRIPDPQAPDTFEASRLRWDETEAGEQAAMLRLHRRLLWLRQEMRDWRSAAQGGSGLAPADWAIEALPPGGVAILRQSADGALCAVIRLTGAGRLALDAAGAVGRRAAGRRWEVLLTTEDEDFSPNAQPVQVELSDPPAVTFAGPAAVLFVARA
jgi:maltooligosyltrehalose trehalohydrolase